MGLAASQARFLGITARKNACELRSMQIAQEKLSITNQLTSISEDYQNSLDATKLVWDSEYITDGSIYDVSFDLLMTPSDLNNFSPQLLTNNKNQIVLDNQYANAIKDIVVGTKTDANGNTVYLSFADMNTGGANRNQTNFIKFLNGLNKGGILSKANLDNMLTALTANSKYYNPNNGLGGTVQEKFTTNSMNLATMKNYINTITNPNSEYINSLRQEHGTDTTGTAPTPYDQIVKLGDLLNFKNLNGAYDYTDRSGATKNGGDISFGEYCSQKKDNKLNISDPSFNFADLLEKEITLSSDDSGQMGDALSKFINNVYGIMQDFFAVNPDSVDQQYLDFAMSQICSLNGLTWDSLGHTASNALNTGAAYSTGDPASKHTGLIKNGNNYQVSLSNLTKGILTYFEKAVEGFDSGYKVESSGDKKVENSYYITQDPEYYYFIKNPEALSIDDYTQLLLDYYSQMFNQLCMNGWTENSLVSEPDSLKNMLKNGTLFTTTLADDGNFYQGPYTSNNFIAEVADEDAITRAEAEFKTQQLKLSAKEEELNIDMQMVDAELSALTTEYDTVKSMISKSVEKGFSTLGG